ncbi:hypothetical protein IB238_23895 [Rhizobium sp. ARZ01]|uniref:hypothetical protein n=1 Tax=Rhizobium sp. ARZ01 TaxID=2769313 RepID=UPI00177E0614|nr:hypothetical protein [Rhizobium sp. ARZ01]MBD9375653.1 hypothetical protein [Rhizobium sp. ARZ01]
MEQLLITLPTQSVNAKQAIPREISARLRGKVERRIRRVNYTPLPLLQTFWGVLQCLLLAQSGRGQF